MASLGTTSVRPGIPTRPDFINGEALSANTARQHTVPAGKQFAYISAEMPIFLTWGDDPVAVIPGSTVTDGTSCLLVVRDLWLQCNGVAKISMISRVAGVVSIAFYT